jgi:DNA-binding response OmpR family regulator
VKRILEEVGLFQVDAFADPTVALSYFRPNRYDLVILDIRMPYINGLELYKKIKAIDEKVKVCFLSAVYVKENVIAAMESNTTVTRIVRLIISLL